MLYLITINHYQYQRKLRSEHFKLGRTHKAVSLDDYGPVNIRGLLSPWQLAATTQRTVTRSLSSDL